MGWTGRSPVPGSYVTELGEAHDLGYCIAGTGSGYFPIFVLGVSMYSERTLATESLGGSARVRGQPATGNGNCDCTSGPVGSRAEHLAVYFFIFKKMWLKFSCLLGM